MELTTRMLKTGERIYKEELELLEEYRSYLEKGVPLRRTNLPQIADLPLLTFKPVDVHSRMWQKGGRTKQRYWLNERLLMEQN